MTQPKQEAIETGASNCEIPEAEVSPILFFQVGTRSFPKVHGLYRGGPGVMAI
jgi:hypothetical protein